MRRALLWLVFLAALVTLGFLIHAGSPPTPRWTARVEGRPRELSLKLTDDGRLLTMPLGDGPAGPLVVRDAATGGVLRSYWEDRPDVIAFRSSADGRCAAAVVRAGGDAVLRWTDTHSGRQQDAALGPTADASVFFSPDATALFVSRPVGQDRRRFDVFDRDSGRHLAALPAVPSVYRDFAGGRFLFRASDGVGVWDLRTHERWTLPADTPHFDVTADGRRALVEREDGYHLWALDGAPRHLAAVTTPYKRVAAFGGRVAVIAPDGEPGTHPVLLIDAETGRERWRYPLAASRGRNDPTVSPDGRFAAVEGDGAWHVLDVEGGRLGWKRPPADEITFSPDSAALLVNRAGRRAVEVHDAATGAERAVIPMPMEHSGRPAFAAGGRQVWLHATDRDEEPDDWLSRWVRWFRPLPEEKAGVLLGLEWPSLRPILRLTDRVVREFDVAADGSFVVTRHEEGEHQLIRRWDVPPPKPWLAAVSLPAALAAFALWLSSRGSTAPASAAPTADAAPTPAPRPPG